MPLRRGGAVSPLPSPFRRRCACVVEKLRRRRCARRRHRDHRRRCACVVEELRRRRCARHRHRDRRRLCACARNRYQRRLCARLRLRDRCRRCACARNRPFSAAFAPAAGSVTLLKKKPKILPHVSPSLFFPGEGGCGLKGPPPPFTCAHVRRLGDLALSPHVLPLKALACPLHASPSPFLGLPAPFGDCL